MLVTVKTGFKVGRGPAAVVKVTAVLHPLVECTVTVVLNDHVVARAGHQTRQGHRSGSGSAHRRALTLGKARRTVLTVEPVAWLPELQETVAVVHAGRRSTRPEGTPHAEH